MSIKSQLSALVQLASIDGDFAGEEQSHIYMIAQANGIEKEEVDQLISQPEPLPPLSTLTDDDRFEYLFNLVQLMKIDSQVYLSEIKYCEDLAEKIGFKKTVVAQLSTRVYSDPSITADLATLKRLVKKFDTL